MSIEVLNLISKEIKEKQEKLVEESRKLFTPMLKQALENNPSVLAIGWHQYTPYFNDGDPCVFNVHDVMFCTDPEMLEESMWEWEYKAPSEELEELAEFIDANEDLMLSLFGDGVQVRVTKEGVEVEEYDHD